MKDSLSRNILLASSQLEEAEQFWKDQLAGAHHPLDLPVRRLAGRTGQREGVRMLKFPIEVSRRILQISNGSEQRILTVLMAALGLVLHKYTRHDDIYIGMPILRQEQTKAYLNTLLPIRMNIQGSATLRTLLAHTQQQIAAAIKHQNCDVRALIGELYGDKDAAPLRFFEATCLYRSVQEESYLQSVTSELRVVFSRDGEEVVGELRFDSDKYAPQLIERLGSHICTSLAQMIAAPDQALSEIELVSGDELRAVLSFNDTEAPFPEQLPYNLLFEEQAKRTPERIAIVDGRQSLTYRDLNEQANRLARYLQDRQVKRGDRVGLCMKRSAETLVAMLAVFKAGCAYVPIDPNDPIQRIHHMIGKSELSGLITNRDGDGQERLADRCTFSFGEDEARLLAYPADNPERQGTGADLAYIIFTSGTTGEPKGAMVHHRGMVNHIYAKIDALKLQERDIVAQTASLSFDISVWQYLAVLLVGGAVQVIDTDIVMDADALFDRLRDSAASIAESVPSLLRELLRNIETRRPEGRALPALRWMMVTGEALPARLANRWFEHYLTIPIVNAYGPTEASDDIAHHFLYGPVDAETSMPIGRPVQNTAIYIMDAALRLCPTGVKGEICVAGPGVGYGYYGDEVRTSRVFVPNPYAHLHPDPHYAKLYRTGDLGMINEEGYLEFYGRMDDQVKIRGYRIELGEIEHVLAGYPEVREAALTTHQDEEGASYLCGYLVSDRELDRSAIRQYMMALLPEYMVPGHLVQLAALPLNSNGKLNRQALPRPQHADLATDRHEEPSRPLAANERAVAELWGSVLGMNAATMQAADNFFGLGGHSLKLNQLQMLIARRFGVELTVGELFRHPTIEATAGLIERAERARAAVLDKAPSQPYYPVLPVQEKMFIRQQLYPDDTSFHISGARMIDGALDGSRLERAFQQLAVRHEAFHTCFAFQEGQVVQRLAPTAGFAIERLEASQEQLDAAIQAFIRPFDLTQSPLIRVGLIELSQGRHVLLIDMHHIIADGTSIEILIEELDRLYRGDTLPPVQTQAKDYAVWQAGQLDAHALDQQRIYWEEQLRTPAPALAIPGDEECPEKAAYDAATIDYAFSPEQSLRLERFAAERQTTPFAVLLSVYYVLLHKYSGQTDIVVGAPVSIRRFRELQQTMGLFINTLPIRAHVTDALSFEALVTEVGARIGAALERSDYPLELLPYGSPQTTLFNAMFVLHQGVAHASVIELGELQLTSYPLQARTTKVDWHVEAYLSPEQLTLRMDYNSERYRPETAMQLVEDYAFFMTRLLADPHLPLRDLRIAFQAEERFWRDKLGGIDWTLSPIRDDRAPFVQKGRISLEDVAFQVPEQTAQAIAHRYPDPAKLFLFLLSNFVVLIRRYKRVEHLVVLTPVFQVPMPSNARNCALPLAVQLDEEDDLKALMRQIGGLVKEATDHHNYPLARMGDFLEVERDQLASVLDTAFMMEGMQDEAVLSQLPSPLSFILKASEGAITGRVRFDSGAFTPAFIDRAIGHYLRLLEQSAIDVSQPIREMELLTIREREQLLLTLNATDRRYELSEPIYRRIERQARLTPRHTAFEYGDQVLSYAALLEKANALAWLLHKRGIGRGSYVPVLINHGLNQPLAMLAVMLCGAAFVPLDATAPAERLRAICEELGTGIALTSAEQPKSAELPLETIVVDYERLVPIEESIEHTASPQDPIYVIYTSGSTGRPKGAIIPHIGIANRFRWMDDYFGCSAQDAILQTTPHIYDSAVWQLFWPLMHGARSILPTPEFEMTLADVLHIVASKRITITDFVPSIFNLLVDQMAAKDNLDEQMSSLRHLIIGGEEMTSRTVNIFRERFPAIRLTNLYGPTETSIGVIHHEVKPHHEGAFPIGRPIHNVKILLLDEYRNLVPFGQQGEIYVTGHCLGLGYLHDPDKTAAHFVDNPYPEVGYAKLYRTGDLGRYDVHGQIMFEGRVDHQIKISGHRVETGEIEAVLLAHPQIKEAAVVFEPRRHILIGCYVPRNELTAWELNAYLQERLPRHMIPSLLVRIDRMPLMKSGKIDRKGLIVLADKASPATDDSAPRTELERQLAHIWEEVLGVKRVGIHDSFLQIGGTSLLILKLHALIVEQINSAVTVAQLFSLHTIAAFAQYLEQQTGAARSAVSDEGTKRVELAESRSADIAIIGMACRLPDADNLQQFWDNLCAGKESIGLPPDGRIPDISRLADRVLGPEAYSFAQMGFLRQVDLFDHAFFQLAPAEARTMDPYQRLFLELVWEAIEHAGYSSARMRGSDTSVFVGYCDNESQYQRYLGEVDASSMAGNVAAIIASRIAYQLDLRGSSQLINTSCSSSLTALHQACHAILARDCDQALVGGVNLSLFPIERHTDFGILSPDRRTRAFDDAADGTVTGEGLGVIFIKSYDQAVRDGDYIHAIIKGSAINADGRSGGITAPNAIAQSEVIRRAWQRARIDPETVSYIEAHGTGTRLGDPIEIEGLQHAFRSYTDKKQFCAIGSVKSNIGHTIAASGIAGVIKVALMLQHRKLPPTLHVSKPNTLIPFIESPVYINESLLPWETSSAQPIRRAGISSFGLSGTNVHIVVEEAQPGEQALPHGSVEGVLALSAKTLPSLSAYVRRFADYMAGTDHRLVDICATSGCGRDAYLYRTAIVAANIDELRERLAQLAEQWSLEDEWPTVAVQGVFLGRGRGQDASEAARKGTAGETAARAFAGGAEVDWTAYYEGAGWRRVPLPTYPFAGSRHWVSDAGRDAEPAEPGTTVVSAGVAFREQADLREIARATFAFGEDLLAQAGFASSSERFGELCGSMAIESIARYIRTLPGTVRILEIAGGVDSLARSLLPKLTDAQLTYTVASWESSTLGRLQQQLEPKFPDVHYLQLDLAKRWSEQSFALHSFDILVATDARRAASDVREVLHRLQLLLAQDGVLCLLETADEEASMDSRHWEKTLKDTNYKGIGVYPAAKEQQADIKARFVTGKTAYRPQPYQDWLYDLAWREAPLNPSHIAVSSAGSWLVFVEGIGVGAALARTLLSQGHSVCTVSPGKAFARQQRRHFTIDVSKAEHYLRLLATLQEEGFQLDKIVHLWSLDIEPPQATLSGTDRLRQAQQMGAYSLFHLTKAILALDGESSLELRVVTHRSQAVHDDEPIHPEQAPIVGLAKVVTQEHPRLPCFVMDLTLGQSSAEELAQQVTAEALGNQTEALVAYRNGRFVPEMGKSKVDMLADRSKPVVIREGGVYLIAGGAGKLGLRLAQHLASKARVTIVLVNRTLLPPKSEWSNWLARPDCDLDEAQKLGAMLDIERTGSTVLYYAANIADAVQMDEIAQEVTDRYGPVHGIVQAVMQPSYEPLLTQSFDSFCEGMRAKLEGTVVLDALAGSDQLDFFVLFSSLASIWGGATGSDYVAANSYLDAYSAYRRYRGRPALALNWYAFEEVTGPGFMGYMPIAGAMQAFDALLSKDVRQMIIGKFDLETLRAWRPSMRVRLAESIFTEDGEPGVVDPSGSTSAPAPSFMWSGRDDEAPTTDQYLVGQIWAEVLGYETLSLDDNYFNLGGDSLLAIGIVNRLTQQAGRPVTIQELFANPTIRQLAAAMAPAAQEERARTIPVAPPAASYPASSSQQRIYVLEQMQDGAVAYNMPTVLQLEGEVNRGHFESAFRSLIERHASFRTAFVIEDSQLIQRIAESVAFDLEYSELSEELVAEEINRCIRPFDLAQAPLLRGKLLRLGPSKHVLVLDMHHIVADGVTINLLIEEFFQLYRGESLPELPIQYKDYSVWQTERLEQGRFKAQEDYWLMVMAGALPTSGLPIDFPRPARKRYTGEALTFEIDAELTDRLIRFGRQRGATLYMTLLAALNILLSKYSGDEDIVIGSPVAGRHVVELEGVAGLFLNTLAMRNFPRSDRSVDDFVEELKQTTLAALSHAEYPFELLVERLKLERDTSRNPLFDVMFILQNTGDAKEGLNKLGGDLRITPYPFQQRSSQFDLTFDIIERNNRLVVDVEYSDELFRRATIEVLAGQFQTVLRALVDRPQALISEVTTLSAAEYTQVMGEWSDNSLSYARDKTVVQWVEEQVRLRPRHLAVQDERRTLTFEELNRRADRLADKLVKHGAGPDRCVALFVSRSVDIVIGMLGILKSGAAFVPIDPDYPEERVSYVLEDSQAQWTVTDRALSHKMNGRTAIVHVDDAEEGTDRSSGPFPAAAPEHLAYMLYTSGSTGRPKGVMVEHRNLAAFKAGVEAAVDFIQGGTWLALTTISFDIFILETLIPLASGSSVVIASEEEQANPQAIKRLILDYQVDMIQLTPSRLQLLLEDSSQPEALRRLGVICVGGESLPLKLLQRLQAQTDARIYNMYGPTETTIWSTVQELTCADQVTIGRPIPNTQAYILDRHLLPVGIHMVGDLYIAGEPVARGYHGRDDLTVERFVLCPYSPGYRMYRTGDRARWLPDGSMEYVGRSDYQVKLHGHRIELGEIEQTLGKHPDIEEAVVTLAETAGDTPFLAAYYIGAAELDAVQLQGLMRQTLPAYMVPLSYTYLERWPLTPNGKLDRLGLPEARIRLTVSATQRSSPDSPIEQQLWTIWQELLQLEEHGVDHNFFEIGGNSLTIVQLHERLEVTYPGATRIADLFAHPTIATLARLIEERLPTSTAADPSDEEEYWLREMEGELLRLPPSYMRQESGAAPVWSERHIRIEGEPYGRLQRAAEQEAVDEADILLALYVHLWSQLTGSQDIYLEQATDRAQGSKIMPLRLDIFTCADFSELFRLVHRKRHYAQASRWQDRFWQQQRWERRQADEVIPLFDWLSKDGAGEASRHDLIHLMEATDEGMVFRTLYNSALLTDLSIQEWLDDYQRLLTLLLEEYAISQKEVDIDG